MLPQPIPHTQPMVNSFVAITEIFLIFCMLFESKLCDDCLSFRVIFQTSGEIIGWNIWFVYYKFRKLAISSVPLSCFFNFFHVSESRSRQAPQVLRTQVLFSKQQFFLAITVTILAHPLYSRWSPLLLSGIVDSNTALHIKPPSVTSAFIHVVLYTCIFFASFILHSLSSCFY